MRVLISGAGIAGPTLAWFLSKSGAHVTIVERSAVLLSHGQNVDIGGSAVTAIKKMGLLDEVRKLNTTEKGTQFIDPNGRPFAPFPQDGSSVSPTSELEILRGDLAKMLYEATKHLPNITYLLDTTIETVVSNNEETVEVELSNGENHIFDILVAADGQWSKTRKQCFSPDSVTVRDLGLSAAYWTLPRTSSDNDFWNIYQGLGSRGISLRPDPLAYR